MELFLVRHVRAVPGLAGLADEARPLAPKSRAKWSQAVRGLRRMDVTFDRLYHGTSLRAIQTAHELARLVQGETVASTHFAEWPEHDLLQEVAGDRVALVGHSPWLGALLAWLLFGTVEHGRRFGLGKGDVAWLEGEPREAGMTLRALLPQKVLRELGRR